ncbi:MAG: VWA domain-containing protein, partial [Candidatus Methanoperedens sp.]|nr:VWA domain-containing protein [Candidatus Methanoperedens sp.]
MHTIKNLFFTLTLTIMLTGLAAGVDVEISSYPSQTTVDESVNISVQVLDNSTPQDNTLINFTTTLGSLGTTSAYTDSSGMATTRINSTISGVATINASVGAVYNTTNVTFFPGEPAFIAVNVTQNPLVVGNATVVNLSAYDQYNNTNSTANMTLNIQIFDILGETINQVNITRASFALTHLVADRSSVTLVNSTSNSSSILLNINSTVAGNITITAKVGNTTNTFNITFTPAALSYISVDYYKECTVNTSSIITVGAWDMYDNPIGDAAVIFNATPPPATKYNSPIEYNSLNLTPEINITNLNGFTSTVFRADKRAGENLINITVGNINTFITIEGIADDATEILLSHTPDAVHANNKDAYRLTAQVVDEFLNPVFPRSVPITKQVLFTTSLGSVIIPLNNNGAAVTLIGPTPYVEIVTVTARYEDETGPTNITGSINLSFVEGDLNRIVIYSSPDTLLSQNIKGNHNASIILTSLDEWGHSIPGINVTLNNTIPALGNLTVAGINATDIINSTTDANGMIQAVFTSKTLVGNATIIASNGTVNFSVNIGIKDVPFLSVNITFEPTSINSGGNVNVTTIISVEGELPFSRPAANAMLVLDTSGSMDPDYYAGTPLDIMLVSDTSGSMDDPIVNTTKKIDAVKTAAKQFNSNMISNDRVGLLTFSGTTTKLYDLTYDMTSINQKIDAQSASGGTPTALAIRNAANYLKNNTRPGARPYIILLSDGLPTYDLKGNYCDDSYPSCSSPTYDALKEANTAKTTFINNNSFIKIYTIGFGRDADNATMSAIASPGSYYYAATPGQLQDIYNNIAQQISDFDITTRQYGTDGFTSYSYAASGIANSTVNWTDTITLNDIVTDFKVFIDNVNLNFTLTSPNGTKYPKSIESGFVNRTGYYNSIPGLEKYRPFRQIAESLASQGIAVLRVDDRGIGKSSGRETLLTVTTFDFADDTR